MFRRQENTLQPDATYSADLGELGYFLDHKGCFRDIEAPELFYRFHCTNDDRHNEVRAEAMRVCHRREVSKRLATLGLEKLYLPTLSTSKPDGPHIPILAPPADVLKTRKRVIVIINDDTYQDLGILAYRELQREGGVNGGSIINFVKTVDRHFTVNSDSGLEKKLAEDDDASDEKNNHVPGMIVLNNGQLLYSHKYNKAMSIRSWAALPRKSIFHDSIKIHEVENHVEGHMTSKEHIKTVFDSVILNSDFVSPDAEVYVVAIENGIEKLINVLHEDFHKFADRITALAAVQSPVGGHAITNPDVKAFLQNRGRNWATSNTGSLAPDQCNALPVDSASPEPVLDGGFCAMTPICPAFGGGDTSVGECVFVQSIVQKAILNFFEEVAQDPKGYCNPSFVIPKPFPDSDLSPLAAADIIDPKKQALLDAQEELYRMHTALLNTPKDRPELVQSLARLQKRIEKKEAEINKLEEA
ncbi:hypothetical protein GRF29_1g2742057 [Pseudopithomyces chartarum]|uniref:Arb2 domain-containing protein n=1 Tax=Pseudopithomyces chartarum TaxID=1892770 RepID=A0AAN6RL69_9PLEO|nr:hypothetical protein GRF29_1g2742057 [Pseudopithomyces chartarum]